MTVKELMKALSRYPEDHLVVLSSDPEGNDFHMVDGVEFCGWDTSERRGDAMRSWVYDDPEDDNSERALTYDESNAVCLWP